MPQEACRVFIYPVALHTSPTAFSSCLPRAHRGRVTISTPCNSSMSRRSGAAAAGGSGGAGPSNAPAPAPTAPAAAAPAPLDLSVMHRHALVQHIMAVSYLSEAEARAVFKRIAPGAADSAFEAAKSALNFDLLPLNLQLNTIRHPLDGAKYIGLVNILSDESSKVASRFSVPQREFFRAVIDFVATEGDVTAPGVCSASETDLMNMQGVGSGTQAMQASQAAGSSSQAAAAGGGGSKPLSKAERVQALRELAAQGWLAVVTGGSGAGTSAAAAGGTRYSLGPRTFLELGKMLLEMEGPSDELRAAWQNML